MNVKIIVNFVRCCIGVVAKNWLHCPCEQSCSYYLTIEDKIKMKSPITITVTVSVNLF